MIVTAAGAYFVEMITVIKTFQCSMDVIGSSWQIVVMVIVETSLNFKFDWVET